MVTNEVKIIAISLAVALALGGLILLIEQTERQPCPTEKFCVYEIGESTGDTHVFHYCPKDTSFRYQCENAVYPHSCYNSMYRCKIDENNTLDQCLEWLKAPLCDFEEQAEDEFVESNENPIYDYMKSERDIWEEYAQELDGILYFPDNWYYLCDLEALDIAVVEDSLLIYQWNSDVKPEGFVCSPCSHGTKYGDCIGKENSCKNAWEEKFDIHVNDTEHVFTLYGQYDVSIMEAIADKCFNVSWTTIPKK
jgi:hypothetical protein